MRMIRTSVEKLKGFDLTALQIFGSIVPLLLSATLNDARDVGGRNLSVQQTAETEVTHELVLQTTDNNHSVSADKNCSTSGLERRPGEQMKETSTLQKLQLRPKNC